MSIKMRGVVANLLVFFLSAITFSNSCEARSFIVLKEAFKECSIEDSLIKKVGVGGPIIHYQRMDSLKRLSYSGRECNCLEKLRSLDSSANRGFHPDYECTITIYVDWQYHVEPMGCIDDFDVLKEKFFRELRVNLDMFEIYYGPAMGRYLFEDSENVVFIHCNTIMAFDTYYFTLPDFINYSFPGVIGCDLVKKNDISYTLDCKDVN